jgi:hypothetical protein
MPSDCEPWPGKTKANDFKKLLRLSNFSNFSNSGKYLCPF